MHCIFRCLVKLSFSNTLSFTSRSKQTVIYERPPGSEHIFPSNGHTATHTHFSHKSLWRALLIQDLLTTANSWNVPWKNSPSTPSTTPCLFFPVAGAALFAPLKGAFVCTKSFIQVGWNPLESYGCAATRQLWAKFVATLSKARQPFW